MTRVLNWNLDGFNNFLLGTCLGFVLLFWEAKGLKRGRLEAPGP